MRFGSICSLAYIAFIFYSHAASSASTFIASSFWICYLFKLSYSYESASSNLSSSAARSSTSVPPKPFSPKSESNCSFIAFCSSSYSFISSYLAPLSSMACYVTPVAIERVSNVILASLADSIAYNYSSSLMVMLWSLFYSPSSNFLFLRWISACYF